MSQAQMMRSMKRQSGRETANQLPQEGAGVMYETVMMFWGDEMGEAIPPTLAARAIPMIKQGPNDDL